MTDPLADLPPDDPRLELLDRYLTELQEGRAPSRDELLRRHPELAPLVATLDALERLALPHATDDKLTVLDPPNGVIPAAGPVSVEIGPGRAFGSYELLEEIGRGGMGVVFKARQRGLNRVVALKMILASHLATPDHVARFQREARAAAKVTHTNVVAVFDVGEVEGQHYFVMEYVPGPTLADRLRDGPLDPTEAARLLAKLARAVAHVHAQNIVHRDLKPANVLVAADGTPKIADFGLARALDDSDGSTRTGVILGTPAYMAPEQAAGQMRKVGPHSDVYSLGAILYELLTGRPPFRSESALHAILQVLENDPEPPRTHRPDVPPKLELIVLKCLEKDPARRYASAKDLADDLEHYLEGEAISARPDTFWESAQRWFRRDPILVTRILGLVLGALVLQVNYQARTDIDPAYHLTVMLVLAGWLVATLLCKRWLRVDPDDVGGADAARLTWTGLDVVGMTWIILLTRSEGGPLVVAYALIIVLSGLWFRVHLVWITTALCEAAYGIVILNVLWQTDQIPSRHWVVTCMVLLALVGAVVAWQVQRIQFLTRRWLER